MKKRFFLALVCAAMMLPASAQWPADDNAMTSVVSSDSLFHFYPLMIRKADGSTLVSYETLGKQLNPETQQRDTDNTFYLYMQKLDKTGNIVWPAPGKLISHQHTLSAEYGRADFDTLPNGNVVFVHAENRHGDSTLISKFDQRIYAYCYDQEGNSVWSEDGVRMPVIPQQKNAFQRRMLQHKITVSGDNIYVTAIIDEGIHVRITPDSVAVRYIIYFEVMSMDFAGNIQAQRIDSVSNFYNYDVSPAPNGDLYYVYTSHKRSYAAQRLNANCENVWSEPTDVDNVNIVSESGLGLEMSVPPQQMTLLEDSSLFLLYYGFPPRTVGAPLFYNRLNPDGSLFGHRAYVTDSFGTYISHACVFEGDTLTIFEAVNRTINGRREECFLYYNRLKLSDATKLLSDPTGIVLEMRVNEAPAFYGLFKTGNEYQLLSRRNVFETNYDYNTVAAYDVNGRILLSKPILGGQTQVYDQTLIAVDHYANLLVTLEDQGTGGIWSACVDVADYTNSPDPVSLQLPGKFTVNADGKQVTFSKGEMEYNRSKDLFQVASNQWEERDGSNQWFADTTNINWFDLFGWGTGDDLMKYDTLNSAYPAFTDWGTKDIRNIACEPGTLRTLSADEWDYILNGRPDAANKRTIGGIIQMVEHEDTLFMKGAILLPDEFEMPEGLHMNMNATTYRTNIYMPKDWARLEANGAVYFPLNAYRNGLTVLDEKSSIPTAGHYWTSTPDGDGNAKAIKIDENGWVIESAPRAYGMGVRLVKDVENPQGIEDIKVKETGKAVKVLYNGQLYIIRDGKVFNATGVQIR